jgi:8-hydroxy-5-deazaflavin:NADPH oxidoreductase
MKFGVMGTGQVGQAVGRKLASLGHDVMLASRQPDGEKARSIGLPVGTHQEAARHGEWIVNALPGEQVIHLLDGCEIDGKIFIDVGNYDHAVDQPIILPLGQAIQQAFPRTLLVKALNSVSAQLMVDPASLGAPHHAFIAGDDLSAKAEVCTLLRSFGWQQPIDLGDLGACRAMEQLIPLWMRLEQVFKGPHFNLKVALPSS